jgi:hypothetical protein
VSVCVCVCVCRSVYSCMYVWMYVCTYTSSLTTRQSFTNPWIMTSIKSDQSNCCWPSPGVILGSESRGTQTIYCLKTLGVVQLSSLRSKYNASLIAKATQDTNFITSSARSHVADGGGGLKMWRLSADVLSKRSRAASSPAWGCNNSL